MNENPAGSTTNSQDPTEQERSVQYFAALVNGWVQTKMEKDRSLLTLSAGAIGLLVTLLTALPSFTFAQFILIVFAIVSFITTLFCLIAVFHINADHLRKVIKNQESSNGSLHLLDTIASMAFVLGVVLSLIAAILFGAEQLKSSKEQRIMNYSNAASKPDFGKSLDGISQLKPDSVPQQSSNTSTGTTDNTQNTTPAGADSAGETSNTQN